MRVCVSGAYSPHRDNARPRNLQGPFTLGQACRVSTLLGGHGSSGVISRSNEVKWGKHWCMDMKLGTVEGIGHTRLVAHVARPSGGQRSSRGQIRSNRVNVGVWA